MWLAQWVAAFTFVVFSLIVVIRTRTWNLLRAADGRQTTTASSAKRQETYAALAKDGSKLEDYDTSELLLGIAVDLYDRKQAAIAVLDDKAQKLLALIGGGATLFALLGGLTGDYRVATLTPLLVLSVLCFFGSLLLCLLSLRPIEMDILAITQFNSIPVLADPAFRARIARVLIEAWQQITFELTPILRRKGRYIFAASILITAGATLLLANFVIDLPTRPGSQPKGNVHCSATTVTRKWQRVTLSCEELKT